MRSVRSLREEKAAAKVSSQQPRLLVTTYLSFVTYVCMYVWRATAERIPTQEGLDNGVQGLNGWFQLRVGIITHESRSRIKG